MLLIPDGGRSDEFPDCCSESGEIRRDEQRKQHQQQLSQFWQRGRTKASVEWSVPPNLHAHEALKTGNISDIINEIVSDRQAWYSDTGNPLTLFLHTSVGDGVRYLEKYTARDQDSNPPWPPRELNANRQLEADSIGKLPGKIMTPALVVIYQDSQRGTVLDDYINPYDQKEELNSLIEWVRTSNVLTGTTLALLEEILGLLSHGALIML